jgi:hypothetical protein
LLVIEERRVVRRIISPTGVELEGQLVKWLDSGIGKAVGQVVPGEPRPTVPGGRSGVRFVTAASQTRVYVPTP